MNPKILVLLVVCAVGAGASRMFILDDGEFEDQLRYRRDVPPQNRRQQPEEAPGVFLPPQGPLEYVPIPPVGDLEGAGSDFHGKGYGYKPGKVGPVYTFVKTDPYAHVKWGVRHVVGKQYAGGHH